MYSYEAPSQSVSSHPTKRLRRFATSELQTIQRSTPTGPTSCVAHVPVTPAGVLKFPSLLLAAMQQIAPGAGFPVQHQEGIEIVTVMLQGKVSRGDSANGRNFAGSEDVQVLSAGRGVDHDETALDGDPVASVVFWLRSNAPTMQPTYARRTIPRVDRLNQLRLVASGNPTSSRVLAVNADVTIHTGVLVVGVEVTHELRAQRRAYVMTTVGRISVDGETAEAGDRVQIRGPGPVKIRALESTEVVVLTA